jgi:DNA-binding PadR family transcriptional regulator
MLEYAILGFLMDRDMTGYDMKQMMIINTSNFIDASFGSIYPMLKRLEKEGLISFEEIVEGNRVKKIYHISEKGKQKFMEWLQTPCTFSPFNFEYLGKLFFYKHLKKNDVILNIELFQGTVQEAMERLLEIETRFGDAGDTYEYETLQFGKNYYEMVLQWHEKLIEKLKEK